MEKRDVRCAQADNQGNRQGQRADSRTLAAEANDLSSDGMAEDLAVVEGDAAASEAGHLGIMGDHDDGVPLGVKAFEEFDDDSLIGGIEISGRLVGEEDGRVVDEGAGDADALLLASTELAGEVAGTVGEAYVLERGAGLGGVGGGVEVLREHYVFYGGEIGDEVELLKDEADLVGAKAVEVAGAHGGDVDTVDPEFTGGGAIEAAEEVDEGAFTGAGGAGDGDPLAGYDGEAGAIEGAHGAGVTGVLPGDRGEGDDSALGAGLVGGDGGDGSLSFEQGGGLEGAEDT